MNVMTRKLRVLFLCLAAAAMALGGLSPRAAEKAAPAPAPAKAPSAAPAPAPAPAQAAAADKISSDTVIMKINGEEVKGGQLEEVLNGVLQQVLMRLGQNGQQIDPKSLPPDMIGYYRTMALKQLQVQVLQEQAIKKLGYTPTEAEIQNEWNLQEIQLKLAYGENETLKGQIEKIAQQDPSLSEASLKKELAKQLQLIRVVEQETKTKIDPTADEIKAIYDKDPRVWGKLQASHILVLTKPQQGDAVTEDKDAQKKAQDILKEVQAGKTEFGELAKKYSDDKGNAGKGGDLGYFYYEAMVPEFSEAAFKLKNGETSGLVKTQYGYHIIKAVDYKPVALDDPKNPMNTRLRILARERRAKVQQYFPAAMMNMVNAAKVENLVPGLAGAENPALGPAAAGPAAEKPAAKDEKKEEPKKK